MSKRLADAGAIAVLATLYVVAARLGLNFDPVAGFATVVWPPTGISLAALLVLGYRVWPGIFIGAALANLVNGATVPVALAIAFGNTSQALVATYLLRRTRFLTTLESASSIVGLIVIAALMSTVISATIGVLSLLAGQIITAAQVRETWRAWWVGDMVGVLLVAPVLLVWSTKPAARFQQNAIERVALAVTIPVVALVSFFSMIPRLPAVGTPFHQADLILAVMIWAAVRFGQRGAATATFGLSAAAVTATATGFGPFVLGEPRDNLMSPQTFMAILGATFLLLGGTIAEVRCALDRTRTAHKEAARANRAKSDFLALMSHELRTPLNAIAGFSALLRDGTYGSLNPQQREALARVEHNERELLMMIDAVLTFVKLEKGELDLKAENVPVEDVFAAVEPLIEPEIQGKRFHLERQLSRLPLAVRADRKALQQIMANLLSNASKFTAEGGIITLGADREDGRVRIWVRDSGIGISEEEMLHVFEPFFQVDSGTTRSYAGVGLGLSIARDLAHRMDGEVSIASKVGAGTTASVLLPAA